MEGASLEAVLLGPVGPLAQSVARLRRSRNAGGRARHAPADAPHERQPLPPELADELQGELEQANLRAEQCLSGALSAALDAGATLSHAGGIGLARQLLLPREHGEGMRQLRALKAAFDPQGISESRKAAPVTPESAGPAVPGAALAARDELVQAGCQVVLEESSSGDSGEPVAALRVQPSSAAALGRAVALLRARRVPVRVRGASDAPLGPPLGGALLDLSALDWVASIDPTSLLARVEAGCSLAALETAARRAGCTLGPLLPSVRAGSVGAWLAGPTRGERGVPPARRETAALSVSVLLRDGRIAESQKAPRSASGPDPITWRSAAEACSA